MSVNWFEICAPVLAVLVSSGVSVYISKKTAKEEIGKLQAIWAHEKEAACDADFDTMVAAVSLFAKRPLPNSFQRAANAVAIYQAKADGDTAVEVDKLSRLIVKTDPDCAAISEQLAAVIACKRRAGNQ